MSAMHEQGATLLLLARDVIARTLGQPGVAHDRPAWLHEPGATFVTLTQSGQLRGCIGSLQAHRSLLEDVSSNALAAALHDPRFMPLSAQELPDTRIEVSLLSSATELQFETEAEVHARLQPGIDGVLLEYGRARGTFLPQVWESLPRPQDFLAHLKRKAGLPADFWHADIRLSRYTVTCWKEADQSHVSV